MKKKIFVSLTIALSVIFAFTFCFAADNGNGFEKATNDVRNFVGGVENTVENAAKDVSNASKDVTGDMENGLNRNANRATTGMNNGNNGRYTSTRTSTDIATDNTVLGMSSTAWTWLILGIAAIAKIAVVCYFSMQFTNNNTRNDE